MIYITFNRSPLPWWSVSGKILPPRMPFKILVVACPTCFLLLFAPTAMPSTDARKVFCWFKKWILRFLTTFDYLFHCIFKSSSFQLKLPKIKSNLHLTITFMFGHLSCSFKISPLLFKSHHTELNTDEQRLFLHLRFSIKSSPLVIYLVKIWDISRPQRLQIPLIILTIFFVLGFTFSYSIILFVLLMWQPPTHHVFVIYADKILFIKSRSTSFDINTTFLFRFKKINLIFIFIFILFLLKNYKFSYLFRWNRNFTY